MGNANYNHIESGATLNISGMGSVNIVSIGASATINKSGMGSVNISGSVGENVKFYVSGMGSLNFAQRPPESVVRNMSKSGMGSVNMPGGFADRAAAQPVHNASFSFGNGMQFSNVSIGNGAMVFGNNAMVFNADDSDDSDDNDNDGCIVIGGLSITSNNGFVNVTQNGVIKRFPGHSSSIQGNRLFVDGRDVGALNNLFGQANPQHAGGMGNAQIMNMLGGMFGNFGAVPVAMAPTPAAAAAAAMPVSAPNPISRPACSVDPSPVQPGAAQEMSDDEFISRCSKPVREYIVHAQENKRIDEKIAELNLTDEEKELFSSFEDPITMDYIGIPVDINEVYYDISTVLKWKFKDPQSREPYESSDVRSGRRLVNDLYKAVETLKKQREEKEQKIVASARPVR